MNKFNFGHWLYRSIFRPLLFTIDSEKIHELMIHVGEFTENMGWLLETQYSYKNNRLKKSLLGINFDNPVGLAAGFDYDGHLAKVIKYVGFGFNTVGTVTAQPYGGNERPRLARLIKSKSILVNKGFKSEGAINISKRLDKKNLQGHTIGISVGSSNIPLVNTINKAIKDYVFSFNVFRNKPYVTYFELNISCPNAAMAESFGTPKNFKKLVSAVSRLRLKQPVFVKMPNEIDVADADSLVAIGLTYGIRGYIFSNLVKDRSNEAFVKSEIITVEGLRGNFSGAPCFENSNKLLAHIRAKFGKKVVLIGVGGIFNANDTLKKFNKGADLVQLVTGMIFEGPQIAGDINYGLSKTRSFG